MRRCSFSAVRICCFFALPRLLNTNALGFCFWACSLDNTFLASPFSPFPTFSLPGLLLFFLADVFFFLLLDLSPAIVVNFLESSSLYLWVTTCHYRHSMEGMLHQVGRNFVWQLKICSPRLLCTTRAGRQLLYHARAGSRQIKNKAREILLFAWKQGLA